MRKPHPLFILIFLVSCHKNKDFNCSVVSVQDVKSNSITNYQYDNNQRVTKVTSSTSPVISSIIYFADSVVESDNTSTSTYYLNNAGLATASQTNISGPNDLSFTDFYTYNNEGYLTKVIQIFSQVYNGNIIKDTSFFNFTIQNGNIVKEQIIQNGNVDEENYDFINIEAKANISYLLKPFYNYEYLGKPSKNLVSTVNDKNGNLSYSVSYQFDFSGNIILTNTTGSSGTTILHYNYQCN